MSKKLLDLDIFTLLNSLKFQKLGKNNNGLFNSFRLKTPVVVSQKLAFTHRFYHKTADGLCSLWFEKTLKTICVRYFTQESFLSLNDYNTVVEKTLEDLHDHFDILADQGYFSKDYDSTLTDGVLTIKLADNRIYVINKQTPNRQLWLSSPESGPKRYDFVDNSWVYSHDPTDTMHEFLSKELQTLFKKEIQLSHLSYAKRN
ncbi:frataxin, mitochondrial isoform X1 [Hydra vulgaris]|uniref:ferroxidase n=1 Tax=Hydra vulgaris TaxID=6087 RepID=T2MCS6_HYDVU|nr:frataxin, mitochondrial isoform X1 [Hydra vulgaris]